MFWAVILLYLILSFCKTRTLMMNCNWAHHLEIILNAIQSLKIITEQQIFHYDSLDPGWQDIKQRLPALSEKTGEYWILAEDQSRVLGVQNYLQRILRTENEKAWLSQLSKIQ